MTATITEARDAMIKVVFDALNPHIDLITYDDTKAQKLSDTAHPWARITVLHQDGGQSTISKLNGKSRYSRAGTLYVNLFAAPGDGLRQLDPLTKIVQDALEGKTTPNGVWFTKVRVREMGVVKGWYQVNVLANFSYDEIK